MSELHVVPNGQEEVRSQEPEDDMAGEDLGDGLGRKPGGVYERECAKEHVFKPAAKNEEENNSTGFRWTKYWSLYGVFHKRHDFERPASPKRLNSADTESEMSNEELKHRLQDVTEEAEILRSELEVTQRQLEGKYEALKILQSRAVFDKATTHTKTLLQKLEERKKVLEKEVNALQWEIEFNQVRFKNHEQSWQEKYDRVCQENALLQETLESREKEIKCLKSENGVLNQQRLELLAMLDVKQNMLQGNGSFSEVTGLELAVLGACACDSAKGNPCPCARTAAATRKELFQLKQELELQKKRKEEAYVIADAFRIAFEQQLKRRNDQAIVLTDVEKQNKKEPVRLNSRKHSKEEGSLISKHGQKPLGQKLTDMLVSKAGCGKLETLDDPQEILNLLIDLLNDKEEALAHQRKVSYMLTRTIEEQERCMKQIKEGNLADKGSSATGVSHQCGCSVATELSTSLSSYIPNTQCPKCMYSAHNSVMSDNPVKSFIKTHSSPRITILERAMKAALTTDGTSAGQECSAEVENNGGASGETL